jgi:O-methyltransferase
MAFTDTAISELSSLLYLDLMKRCLTRSLFPEALRPAVTIPSLRSQPLAWAIYSLFRPVLGALGLELSRPFSATERAEGRDWPLDAETMVGLARLQNLEDCVTDVLHKGIPGDLIEAGVWRGGACIFMRAILKAYGDQQRIVWVADSFQGLPQPDGRYPRDTGDRHWQYADVLAVSLEQVKSNFDRYGLLDRQVAFLAGWFKDTLPAAPIQQISVLRLDGDMYASTMDALVALYPKLSPGGYAIVDDYGAIPTCQQAVDDFRRESGIQEPLEKIDWSGVFWRKK